MLYTDFIYKAMDLTIEQADNGLYYLEPLWRNILYDNQMDVVNISDADADWGGVLDVLNLEVTKRNTINSKKPDVLNWLYDLITSQVEPAMLEEENDYLKNVIEYMKTNHEIQKTDEEWNKFKNS